MKKVLFSFVLLASLSCLNAANMNTSLIEPATNNLKGVQLTECQVTIEITYSDGSICTAQSTSESCEQAEENCEAALEMCGC
jgi:hypothetical protein